MSRILIAIFFLAGVPVIANEMQVRTIDYSASSKVDGSTYYKNSSWPRIEAEGSGPQPLRDLRAEPNSLSSRGAQNVKSYHAGMVLSSQD